MPTSRISKISSKLSKLTPIETGKKKEQTKPKVCSRKKIITNRVEVNEIETKKQ